MNLSLPWPPSLNSYLRHITIGGKPRTLLSKAAREYQGRVASELLGKSLETKTGRLAVEILAYPPDRRRRDLDGMFKVVLDCLTKCGIWEDDSQIDSLKIVRKEVVPDGRLEVFITEM